MNIIAEGIKLIGGLAGIIALSWKTYEEFKVYLRLRVETTKDGEQYTVLTEIENISRFSDKGINNAFLIVSPEKSELIKDANAISDNLDIDDTINYTNDFKNLKADHVIYLERNIVFIPLPFYYNENIAIGNEKLTYRCSIDSSQLESGNYSVRFFLFGKRRYLRSTQDLLIIN